MAKNWAKQLATKAFYKAWRLTGSPMLDIIAPVSSWALPDGVTYSAHYDEFMDESGAVVSVTYGDKDKTSAPFLPKVGQKNVDFEIPGVVTTHTTDVTLLWSAELQAAVASAWGVLIDGQLYRVDAWRLRPLGVTDPIHIDLVLAEGE